MNNFCVLTVIVCLGHCFVDAEELWEQDLSKDMKIGISTSGYHSVDLKCDHSSFLVNVTLDNDFDGVIYTRGSYSKKKQPCYIKSKVDDPLAIQRSNHKIYTIKIPFNKCQTVMDVADSKYTNTIVIQHDEELIMPGDAAFDLDCAFEPEFKLTSDVETNVETNEVETIRSKITLVDADPAAEGRDPHDKHVAASSTSSVRFSPNNEKKDEL